MSAPVVILPRRLVNLILHRTQLSPDRQIAGLIGAKDGIPRSCQPVEMTPDGDHRLDPVSRDEALRSIESRGETLFAVLHSHPASPAEPTNAELLESGLPVTPRIIVSLNTKGVLEMRGFIQNGEGTARELALALAQEG